MTNCELKNKLQTIANETENTIEKAVIDEILSHYEDDIETGFDNIVNYHRSFGMVTSFTLHNDMEAFFDNHYQYINDIILGYEDRYGSPISFYEITDVKSELGWIAFQETADRMANELELEI